jgi:hypothetical protein
MSCNHCINRFSLNSRLFSSLYSKQKISQKSVKFSSIMTSIESAKKLAAFQAIDQNVEVLHNFIKI